MSVLTRPIRTPQEANFKHLVYDIAWFGIALASSGQFFLSVYAVRVGATPTQMSLLTALPAMILLFASIFSVRWRNRYPDSIKALKWPTLGHRLVFLLPFFTPFFPLKWQPVWLLLSVTLPALPQGIGVAIFLNMMREAIEENRFTTLLSRRGMAMNLGLAVSVLISGWWLEKAPYPMNYQMMFLLAFGASLVSAWHVYSIQPIPEPQQQPELFYKSPVSDQTSNPTMNPFPSPWQSAAFRRSALVTALSYGSFFAILPLIPLHLIENLNAREGFMGLFSLTQLIAAAMITLFTTRLAHYPGNRSMTAIGVCGTAASALIVAFSPSLPFTLLAAFLTGMFWTATDIGQFGYFSENAPKDTRYTRAHYQIIALGIFVGPMIGGLLADSGLSLKMVLLIGAGLRLMVGVFIASRHEKKPIRIGL